MFKNLFFVVGAHIRDYVLAVAVLVGAFFGAAQINNVIHPVMDAPKMSAPAEIKSPCKPGEVFILSEIYRGCLDKGLIEIR